MDDRTPGVALRRDFFDALDDADVVRVEIPIQAPTPAATPQWLSGALFVTASKTTGEITAHIGMRTAHIPPISR